MVYCAKWVFIVQNNISKGYCAKPLKDHVNLGFSLKGLLKKEHEFIGRLLRQIGLLRQNPLLLII